MIDENLLSSEELRAKVAEAASDLRQSAEADAETFATVLDDADQDIADEVYADFVGENAAFADAVNADNYVNPDPGSFDVGSTPYEVDFNEARRSLVGAAAKGIDQFVAITLGETIKTIDEFREVIDELAVEAAQISAAAAAGFLIPPLQSDLEDYQDFLADATSSARLTKRELDNLEARREASIIANGFRNASTITATPARPLIKTPKPSEPQDRDDQGQSFVLGRSQMSPATVTRSMVERLRNTLNDKGLEKMGYIAICGVLSNLSRIKSKRDKAKKIADKMKRMFDSLKTILSGSFFNDLQADLEKRANASVSRALDLLQHKVEAVDKFIQSVIKLPGPFVSTVKAIGDVPNTAPLANSLASLCGLKGARFCDINGLMEIAKSLDTGFGLQLPRVPIMGRAIMTLNAPTVTQVPAQVTIPGQEADLILVSFSNVTLVARFSRENAPTTFDSSDNSFHERADAFGNGDGTITLIGDGSFEDQVFGYSSVSFDENTGNYTFTLTSAGPTKTQTIRGESDSTVLGVFWDESTSFPVGSTSITLRTPEAQQRDIATPCSLALGFGEQEIISGEYDASTPSQIRALSPAFASWMVGLSVDIGPASANGVAERRTITSVDVLNQIATYDGVTVPASLPGNRGTFRLTLDKFETVTATATSAGPDPDLLIYTLASPTTRPHGRESALPQKAVRIAPTLRDEFLDDAETPASGDVRDPYGILPEGSVTFTATYVDQNQDALLTPIITGLSSGKLYINKQGPFDFSAATQPEAGQLTFTLTDPTSTSYIEDSSVEVETTDMLDQFEIQFPSSWFDPVDIWAKALDIQINTFEAKLCRLLSGSNQDIAASGAIFAALATALSGQLTTARVFFVMWLTPIIQQNSVTRALDKLQKIGANRAGRQIREGRIGDFVGMEPAEGSDIGATMIVAQSYQKRVTTEEQFRILSKAVAEIRGKFEALTVATNAVSDAVSAREKEIAQRKAGARKLEALQEQLP